MIKITRQRFFHVSYCWGAAIMLLGVLFKLMQLPYGNTLLFAGMGAECFIFFISAFDNTVENTPEVAPTTQLLQQVASISRTVNELTNRLKQLNDELNRIKVKYEK